MTASPPMIPPAMAPILLGVEPDVLEAVLVVESNSDAAVVGMDGVLSVGGGVAVDKGRGVVVDKEEGVEDIEEVLDACDRTLVLEEDVLDKTADFVEVVVASTSKRIDVATLPHAMLVKVISRSVIKSAAEQNSAPGDVL